MQNLPAEREKKPFLTTLKKPFFHLPGHYNFFPVLQIAHSAEFMNVELRDAKVGLCS